MEVGSAQGGRYYIVPGVKQVHDITVSFQLPSLFQHYDAKVRAVARAPIQVHNPCQHLVVPLCVHEAANSLRTVFPLRVRILFLGCQCVEGVQICVCNVLESWDSRTRSTNF